MPLDAEDRIFPLHPAPVVGDQQGALSPFHRFDPDPTRPGVQRILHQLLDDRSGTLASTNYWHHDTIRIRGYSHLGDSTWWCGTYNECWRQPRGYANDWIQILERHFTEASSAQPTDAMRLEYDQRYAMENNYDYGYGSWETRRLGQNQG